MHNKLNVLFIGLGRIGLPQSLVFAKREFEVLGYDADEKLVGELNEARIPFSEKGMAECLKKYLNLNYRVFADWQQIVQRLSQLDAIFFTLGTSAPNATTCLNEENLNLDNIFQALDKIFLNQKKLKKQLALIFRTTLPLGSIDRIREYLAQHHEVIESRDYFLAFVPERLMEGAAIAEEENLPKIIGAYSDAGFVAVQKLFSKIGGTIIRVANPMAAEFCKLTDNSYRNTMFSFANELALTAAEWHVDAIEVIKAVNQEYNRNKVPLPGFVSGYCLGKDPYVFEYAFRNIAQARKYNSLWYTGRRINDDLITYTLTKVKDFIAARQLESPNIVLLGLSFKENIDDFRMSHSLEIIRGMIQLKLGNYKVYDPYLDVNRYTKIPADISADISFTSKTLSADLFADADIILLLHRHAELVVQSELTIAKLLEKAHRPVYIFDGWNIWRPAQQLDFVVYEGLGYAPQKSAYTSQKQVVEAA